ncbi:glycogen debranching protein [Jiella sp. MQZ9-1]|uniref:Glycogen debranching protein n=1 Tax=Jiella flava TaxID=2816857 RepID=A0A939FX44_9HYPH|nr:glycogen debranching protein [Jiella flava]MBO0661112.1 glycogen debranching protein [Jiella flava]MCD2469758.1 glycogen debranching protein [Jiella flava]
MMKPTPEGEVTTSHPVLLPIMAPRLQADVSPEGYVDLALWASGSLGRVRFSSLCAPYVYGPNRLVAANGAIYVAQSKPILLITGAQLTSLHPARRCAWWHETTGEAAKAKVTRTKGRRTAEIGWGVVIVETDGADLRIAVGASLAEAEGAFALSNEQIVAEAADYAMRCDAAPEADPLLRSMVVQGVHAALSSIRQDENGAFAGLAAGQAYSAPARTYYRDGYWTMQALLRLAPEAVREEIRLLAKGIQPDGEAPSGVILTGPAQSQAWQRFVADCRANPGKRVKAFPDHHNRPGDWWSDHFDSPLFFILFLGDYVEATGDIAEAQAHWPIVATIIERYLGFAGRDSVLPLKPRNDRDWADNVYREGLVSYDLGLFVGSLDAVAKLGADHDPMLAGKAREVAAKARAEVEDRLFVSERGSYADYIAPDGFVEDHLVLDSVTLARYDAISPERAIGLLNAFGKVLESRHNSEQPYGDWGVLCAYPPFKRAKDTRSKTAFHFRYHNGSDWPYWDGAYAEERLRRGLGGARYALTRWWETCLANGWAGAVEYFSPPYGRGSLLQGWSAMPAAVVLKYGLEAVNAEGQS